MFAPFIKNYVRVSALIFAFFPLFPLESSKLLAEEAHFNITSVDGHPLSGSLSDTTFDGRLPRDICHQSISEAEKQKDIPRDLLAAVAFVEAGRWQGTNKDTLIWPWSLTVNGKGHFYETPELAINAAETFFAHGLTNIDVGCMQINVRYHKNAFSTLAEMFDPIYNTAYAATFLVSLKEDLGTWSNAVEGYHSRKAEHGKPYGEKVMNKWTDIRKKRRADHQEAIVVSHEKQKQQQVKERAQQAQIRAEQQAKLEAKRKEIKGTEAGEWSRPSHYKSQKRDEITARARVLTPPDGLPIQKPPPRTNFPRTSSPDTNSSDTTTSSLDEDTNKSNKNTIIYHTLKDNQKINTSEQWLLQKLDEWERTTPSSRNPEILP